MIVVPTESATMTSDDLVQRLRTLTGQHFSFLDGEWRLIEVLGAEDALVLQRIGSHDQVQSDQYGQPLRRTPQTLTLPLSGDDAEGYSEEVLALLAGRLHD